MSLKLKLIQAPVDKTIPAVLMKDGQLAVIKKWGSRELNDPYIGRIVQKRGSDLIMINENDGWCGFFSTQRCTPNKDYRVELLKKGDRIEISE